jgi:drug/metabolite transporter (DMT)-like permease
VIAVVALALGAALAYGAGDFLGGVAARRATVFGSTTVNTAVAAALLAVVVAATGGVWSTRTVIAGIVAGALALVGFLAFFAALAAGPISLVTPLIALLSSAVPVGAALVAGETLGPLVWVAIAIAVAGSVLIGIEHRISTAGLGVRTVVLTLTAGLGFGFATVALDRVPDDSGLIPVLLDSGTGAVVLLAVAAIVPFSARLRRWLALLDGPADEQEAGAAGAGAGAGAADRATAPPARRHWVALAVGAGLLTGIANVLLMLGLHAGSVAVVAVLTNLYPLATMALAWIVLRERLSAAQLTGALLALSASVLLGFG